jgi:hypothetical protein
LGFGIFFSSNSFARRVYIYLICQSPSAPGCCTILEMMVMIQGLGNIPCFIISLHMAVLFGLVFHIEFFLALGHL